jgi:hypothetical protein
MCSIDPAARGAAGHLTTLACCSEVGDCTFSSKSKQKAKSPPQSHVSHSCIHGLCNEASGAPVNPDADDGHRKPLPCNATTEEDLRDGPAQRQGRASRRALSCARRCSSSPTPCERGRTEPATAAKKRCLAMCQRFNGARAGCLYQKRSVHPRSSPIRARHEEEEAGG